MKKRKTLLSFFIFGIAFVGILGMALSLFPSPPNMQVHAASDVTTQNLGYNDSVTVPLENLIVSNLQYDYPPPYVCPQPGCLVVHLTGATLLRFVFNNGTAAQEIGYQIWERKGGGIILLSEPIQPLASSWNYDIYYDNSEYDDLLTFTNTSNGLVVTQNLNSLNKDVFNQVTIYTYQSSCTIQAGAFIPTEFTVTFIDIDGNVIATAETVGRYIPTDLVPSAPEINQRPFMRWTSIQGLVVDEIITANVTFIPLYGYDPNYEIKPPTEQNDIQNKFDISSIFGNTTFLIIAVVLVFLFAVFLINLIKEAFKV